MRQGRGSEATEDVFCIQDKKASLYRGAYRVPLFNLSLCLSCNLSVCVSISVCVTFVDFTDCESCTRPISTNPGCMEAGQYGFTRVTCFLACRLELDAVAGLLWLSRCVLGGVDFLPCFFHEFAFSNSYIKSSQRRLDSVKGLRQPANLPTENSRPPIPTRCTV